jgi:hypothetical protein
MSLYVPCYRPYIKHNTNIYAPGEIRTHNPIKRAAADPRLRPRGHWDRRVRTRASTVRAWRLTAWAMARPMFRLTLWSDGASQQLPEHPISLKALFLPTAVFWTEVNPTNGKGLSYTYHFFAKYKMNDLSCVFVWQSCTNTPVWYGHHWFMCNID